MSSTVTPLPAQLDKIVERFKKRTDPKQRYQQLLAYGKKLPPMKEEDKVPENQVSGCVSQVYIAADLEEGQIFYRGDSDAQLVKGLVAFLITGINGLTPAEVLQIPPDFITETGIPVSLTPSRANGFYNIFQMMRQKALILLNR
ncbi:MAG: SufE family protein [Prochloron sp. SP5CPC1]|nr:SufE family protein [Candidatus Paraprochloron terpiosi SP5CPC1]